MQDDPLPKDLEPPFASLPRAVAPPASLEDRVARELRASGALRPPGGRPVWLQIAAAVVLVAAGFALGRATVSGTAPVTKDARYLLLLYGARSTPGDESSRIAEYAAWARAESAEGRLLSGEKLGDRAGVVGDARGLGSVSLKEPSGFFVIRAASFDEAVETASRCPHTKHGGAVLVRPIQDTQ